MTQPRDCLALGVQPPRAPLHLAIDRLTVALLEVQRLRRQRVTSSGADADFDRLEATLQEIGEILLTLRDGSD